MGIQGLNETPRANRLHIVFVGNCNAGKSTLINAFTGQSIAIVSATPGTTTDPVSKAMEILPLGPCLVTDTAGLDDTGELGSLRVAKTLETLSTADVAVWVSAHGEEPSESLRAACQKRACPLLVHHRGDSVEALRRQIAALQIQESDPPLLQDLVSADDEVICVCPIDGSAPKGRLILPQVQVLRACLDSHIRVQVCQPTELEKALQLMPKALVITDSQAFAEVRTIVANHPKARLTSFSILFARQKGDWEGYVRGMEALVHLRPGSQVLVAEGCTHHRQCNDIGTVKIPRALARLAGGEVHCTFTSGCAFSWGEPPPNLIVQCGGCMLTRREVCRRMELARAAQIPMVNYGLLLAVANGMRLQPGTCLVKI